MRKVDPYLGRHVGFLPERHADEGRAKRLLSSIVAVLALTLTTIPPGLAGQGEAPAARPLGEVSEDKALVYLIRPKLAGPAPKLWVYSDRDFLGALPESSYGFAYVVPGEHILWQVLGMRSPMSERFEFVGGQTYYVQFDLKGFTLTMTALCPTEGPGVIQAMRSYAAPTAQEIEKAKRKVESKWAKVQERDAAEPRAAIEKMAAKASPADQTGKVRIPKGTTVELELLENVSSALNPLGDTVRFRVVDDFVIEGTTLLYAGTRVDAKLRKVTAAEGSGRHGAIDIVFPGVRAADGSPVPLSGRVMHTGKNSEKAAFGIAGALGGLFGGLADASLKGGDVLLQIGALYEVVTPVDVWVDPARATDPAPGAAGVDRPELTVHGAARDLECSIAKACRGLDDVVVRLKPGEPVSRIAIRAIEGLPLAAPITPSAIVRGKDGSWICTFSGWSVVRNVALHEGTTTTSLHLEGSLANGTAFQSDTAVALLVRP